MMSNNQTKTARGNKAAKHRELLNAALAFLLIGGAAASLDSCKHKPEAGGTAHDIRLEK